MSAKPISSAAPIQAPANGNKVAETFTPVGDAAKAVLAKLAAKMAK